MRNPDVGAVGHLLRTGAQNHSAVIGPGASQFLAPDSHLISTRLQPGVREDEFSQPL